MAFQLVEPEVAAQASFLQGSLATRYLPTARATPFAGRQPIGGAADSGDVCPPNYAQWTTLPTLLRSTCTNNLAFADSTGLVTDCGPQQIGADTGTGSCWPPDRPRSSLASA